MGKLFGGFSASELKPRLKMATHRFQLSIAKKSAIMRQQKREIALMLAETPHPKEEKARIRAEALIREDNTVEAMEILQLECELLYERILLVRSQDTCPSDLVSCVSTLIWASQRVDIPELQDIRHQFRSKYGKKFDEAAITNAGGICNERVVAKLSIEPPTAILVRSYLEKIAEEYEVDWKPRVICTDESLPVPPPTGYSVQIAAGSGLGTSLYPASTGISTRIIMPDVIPPPSYTSSDIASTSSGYRVYPNAPPMSPATVEHDTGPMHIVPPPPTTNTPVPPEKDDDDDNPTNGGQPYDDLAARFSKLKH